MDIAPAVQETCRMGEPGRLRERLARTLNAAFAEGLLSEQTHSYRLGLLFGPPLLEPHRVVGDLALRGHRRRAGSAALSSALVALREGLRAVLAPRLAEPAPLVLALDWTGGAEELLIGREEGCDVPLGDATVSRRHARLVFRDGGWTIQDLASKNGITVNGVTVGRCRLMPGDRLGLGLQVVDVD
jgi:hypothetical protein